MAESYDMKLVVQHLANGTLGDTLCLICLSPLKENNHENIFTLFCKEDKQYCTAEVLDAFYQLKLQGTENYKVCIDCFKSASLAYKFYLQAKRSLEIITFYTQELLDNIDNVQLTDEDTDKLLFVPLSSYTPETDLFEFTFNRLKEDPVSKPEQEETENKIVMVKEGAESSSFKLNKKDESIEKIETNENSDDDEEMLMIINEKKIRKKRYPMAYISCSHCPIKYRFMSKLKDHVKSVHGVDLYYCKICKLITEDRTEYEEHVKTHSGEHQCMICNVVYKKYASLVLHMKTHMEGDNVIRSENANICEICGALLDDEGMLQEHIASKHVKKYTCYYCGKMYKGEGSFEAHVRKHETHWKQKQPGQKCEQPTKSSDKQDTPQTDTNKSRRSVCLTCGKDFVDERSLLWHQRLHNDDRPYTCDVCGRGFVSLNRRNQHALCAHTPPARRCPLCPALFHLRSMVNTHVKKVHLKAHKRRNRTAKHQNVFWRTETVPIQELSVSIQNEILELQTRDDDDMVNETSLAATPYRYQPSSVLQ